MPAQLSSRTLELRHSAYSLLHVTAVEVACAPQITPQLAMIERTIKRSGQPRTRRSNSISTRRHNKSSPVTDRTSTVHTLDDSIPPPYGPGSDIRTSWPFYLALTDHADARKVLSAYNSLSSSLQRVTPIEAYCVAASVSPLLVLDMLVAAVSRSGALAAAVVAAANQPRVVQKSVEMALTSEGILDRQLLARATGFLPSPRGSQINIHTSASANAQSAAVTPASAPAPEQTNRRLAERLSELRGLPPAPPNPLDAAAMPEREMLTIDIPLNDSYTSDTDDDMDDAADEE